MVQLSCQWFPDQMIVIPIDWHPQGSWEQSTHGIIDWSGSEPWMRNWCTRCWFLLHSCHGAK